MTVKKYFLEMNGITPEIALSHEAPCTFWAENTEFFWGNFQRFQFYDHFPIFISKSSLKFEAIFMIFQKCDFF